MSLQEKIRDGFRKIAEKIKGIETKNSQKLSFLYGETIQPIGTAAKIVTADRSPVAGDIIIVKYIYGTNASNATLNINGSGAKNIRIQNGNANGVIHRTGVNGFIFYYYDGSFYHMLGSQFNALYSNISIAEAKAGTATTSRYITAQILKEMAKRENHSGTQGIDTVVGLQEELDKMVKTNTTNLFEVKQRFGTTMNNDDYYVEIDNNIPGVKMGGGDYADGLIRSYEAGMIFSVNGRNTLEITHNNLIVNGQYWTNEWQNFTPVFYDSRIGTPSVQCARYKIIGKTVFVHVRFQGQMVSDTNEFGFDGIPVTFRNNHSPSGWIYNFGNFSQGIVMSVTHPRENGAKIITMNTLKAWSLYECGISIVAEIV